MNYSMELMVPKTATSVAPARATTPIARGIIVQVDIECSKDVNGTVMCQLYLAGQQLYPIVTGTAYRLWTNSINFRDNYPTFPKETPLELRAWANGARYNHTIDCYVNIMPFTTKMRKVS